MFGKIVGGAGIGSPKPDVREGLFWVADSTGKAKTLIGAHLVQ
jgi:hypothetical protein